MREIKFRAWNIETNFMCDEMSVPSASYVLNNKLYEPYGSEFVLMQYTGLKDKNAKPIYEGDIVQLLNVEDGEERVRSSVTFEDGAFVIYKGTVRLLLGSCSFTLIGNLYENPDLLSKPSTWNDAGDVNHDLYGDRSIG